MKEYKGYLISAVPTSPSLMRVATSGQGGKIPRVLEGYFTSTGEVQRLIDKYQTDSEAKNVRKTVTEK